VTIEEMHIAVNLGVQKIGSFQVDNLLPEEIDHELNLAQRRFIKQRYSSTSNAKQQGFEQSQKRLDDLRNLVEDFTAYENFYMGPVYTSSSRGDIFVDRYKLPLDYMHLLSVRSEVKDGCNKPIQISVTNSTDHYLRIPTTLNLQGYYLVEIQIANEEGGADTIRSNQNGLTIDDLREDTYPFGIEPSLSPNDTFSDLTSNRKSSDSPPADANEIFLKRNEAADSEDGGFFSMSADGKDATHAGAYAILIFKDRAGNEETINVMQPPISLVNQTRTHSANDTKFLTKRTLCKYVQQDDIYKVLDDPFSTTKASSPLYTMQENFVDLYSNIMFLPTTTVIKYLRRPALMRRATGSGSELPEHTHDEVVEMAIKSILEAIESPRYQSQSGEVLESE
tara:strand:- start:38633 stop:39814 length:1182 start_codon:yes stop_codon:yes gene_type:complete